MAGSHQGKNPILASGSAFALQAKPGLPGVPLSQSKGKIVLNRQLPPFSVRQNGTPNRKIQKSNYELFNRNCLNSRSSSREVRIRVPTFFCSLFFAGEPSQPKQGQVWSEIPGFWGEKGHLAGGPSKSALLELEQAPPSKASKSYSAEQLSMLPNFFPERTREKSGPFFFVGESVSSCI